MIAVKFGCNRSKNYVVETNFVGLIHRIHLELHLHWITRRVSEFRRQQQDGDIMTDDFGLGSAIWVAGHMEMLRLPKFGGGEAEVMLSVNLPSL